MPEWPTEDRIKARAAEWTATHWAAGCPICRAADFTIGTELVVSLPIHDGALHPLETFVGHPYVQVICRSCGFMAQLSSSVLGLTGESVE